MTNQIKSSSRLRTGFILTFISFLFVTLALAYKINEWERTDQRIAKLLGITLAPWHERHWQHIFSPQPGLRMRNSDLITLKEDLEFDQVIITSNWFKTYGRLNNLHRASTEPTIYISFVAERTSMPPSIDSVTYSYKAPRAKGWVIEFEPIGNQLTASSIGPNVSECVEIPEVNSPLDENDLKAVRDELRFDVLLKHPTTNEAYEVTNMADLIHALRQRGMLPKRAP